MKKQRGVLFFIVLILLSLGGWLWWADAMAPVEPSETEPVLFVIEKGEGVKSIASRLSSERLIRSPTGFFVLVKVLGIETNLQAGAYRLKRSSDAREIATELTHGITDVWVTTLEGWRSEEIAIKLAKEMDIPENEFLKFAREGYMFPDTYLIVRDATAAAIVNIFLTTFDKRITSQMRSDAKKSGLTLDQIIILSSIVEREGRTDADRPVIAGILLKRLKAGWALQADSTLQYALGYQPFQKSWWKKSLTSEDKLVKSPFNTYLHPGLPPSPIANPGLASIKAVIYPTETDYWFYLHDNEGRVHYAKTVEEHNANIARYLQ